MYDRDATETSKGALVELCRALRQYRSDMVLAGGWAPYFLVKDYFDHCGSIDIDFVLKPKVIGRYENIKQILERLRYASTGSVFRFERRVASPKTGREYRKFDSDEVVTVNGFANACYDNALCIVKPLFQCFLNVKLSVGQMETPLKQRIRKE